MKESIDSFVGVFLICGETPNYFPQILRRKMLLFSAKSVFLHGETVFLYGKIHISTRELD